MATNGQGINLFANSPCLLSLSYLASAKTVCNILLPAKTTVHDKFHPVKTVHMILLPAETLGRKQNHVDSPGRKTFFSPQHSLREARDGEQSWRKPNIMDSLSRQRQLTN